MQPEFGCLCPHLSLACSTLVGASQAPSGRPLSLPSIPLPRDRSRPPIICPLPSELSCLSSPALSLFTREYPHLLPSSSHAASPPYLVLGATSPISSQGVSRKWLWLPRCGQVPCCSKHMLASQRQCLKNLLLSPQPCVPKSPTKPLRNMAPTQPSPPLVGEAGRGLQQRKKGDSGCHGHPCSMPAIVPSA